ncbi:MAG: hypothetical protein QG608_3319 [Actinomycetota bacterium]|nr:hypothetical protein [Actinomycetota bacterium]
MALLRTSTSVRILVEGLCLAGKTTLTQALATGPGTTRVPEYADLTQLPPWPPQDVAAARQGLAYLTAVEEKRHEWAAASGTAAVVFDRGPLTLVAHEVAMSALNVPADPHYAARLCSRFPAPHAIVYLDVDDDEAIAREQRRGALPAHLVAPEVRAVLRSYYERALGWTDDRRVLRLSGSAPLTDLVLAVRTYLHNLPQGPLGRWLLPETASHCTDPMERPQ